MATHREWAKTYAIRIISSKDKKLEMNRVIDDIYSMRCSVEDKVKIIQEMRFFFMNPPIKNGMFLIQDSANDNYLSLVSHMISILKSKDKK